MKLLEEINLENGDWYKLYATGKTFKSVTFAYGFEETKKHRHLDAALTGRNRLFFLKMKEFDAQVTY